MDKNGRHSRASRPQNRTSNACEACKRRKTKCTGHPSPCDVCKRADTFCNFNPKLDTRRKASYTSSNIQDRQQFMITALLQTIKHAPEHELQHLVSLVRGPSRPDAVAACLCKQFAMLQTKGVIPAMDVDDTDVISFGLQGLCGHRKGRARTGSSTQPDAVAVFEESSSDSLSDASQTSSPAMVDTGTFDNPRSGSSPSPLEHSPYEGFDSLMPLDSASMFAVAANEPQPGRDARTMHEHQRYHHHHHHHHHHLPSTAGLPLDQGSNISQHPGAGTDHDATTVHDPSMSHSSPGLSQSPVLFNQHAGFGGGGGFAPDAFDNSMRHYNMAAYQYCMVNGISPPSAPPQRTDFEAYGLRLKTGA